MTRKRISDKTETRVLMKSRRRCCLCYGLNYDFDIKRGQLAHINHDSSDSEAANLAFLCLEHHDLYDSKTSQSKGFSKSELLQYRKMLYDFIENKSSTAQTHSKSVEDEDQKVIPRSDYITNSTQEIQKELVYLSDRLLCLKDEKKSAESLGLLGSVKTLDVELDKICSRIEVCSKRSSIIEAGYDSWDTTGFNLTCEYGGFLDTWDIIGEMKDGTFYSNPESNIRIPMSTHDSFRKAIDSRLFTKFLVCLLYDDWDIEANTLGTDCDYYLFGATLMDDISVFLIDTWTTNDL